MPYRLYRLNSVGGFTEAIDLDCRDDDEARAQMSAFPSKHGLELWQGERKICRLMPTAHAA